MPNKWIISLTLISILITSMFYKSEAKDKSLTEASCLECHGNIEDILPENHSAVKGNNITACLTCHAPSPKDPRGTDPFSTRLHRFHLQPGNEIDCLVCHTYDSGNSFGLQGVEISYGSPQTETMKRIREVFISWSDSLFLDSIHSRKDITCFGCHGRNLFDEEKPSISETCVSCHPGYIMTPEEISSSPSAEINPHKSHQGNLDCTICHKSHEASILYCQKCHGDFILEIPGGAALPAS